MISPTRHENPYRACDRRVCHLPKRAEPLRSPLTHPLLLDHREHEREGPHRPAGDHYSELTEEVGQWSRPPTMGNLKRENSDRGQCSGCSRLAQSPAFGGRQSEVGRSRKSADHSPGTACTILFRPAKARHVCACGYRSIVSTQIVYSKSNPTVMDPRVAMNFRGFG